MALAIDRTRVDQLAGFLWTVIRTDFKVRYHGTLGGFGWALLKPCAMFLVLMGVFSFVFASDPNYRLNLIVGLIMWDFFAESTKVGLTSLMVKRHLLTRARFPTWIVVISSASNAVITLAVFAVVLTVALVISGRPPSVTTLALFGLYQLSYLLLVVGFTLGASVLFLRYRDLNQVWEVITQAGFFFAPIIYPLDILPERLHIYLYLWLPTPVIQFTRSVLIDGVVPTARAHLLLAAMVVVVFATGVLIHRRLAPGSMERL